jgi:hypothetical protein
MSEYEVFDLQLSRFDVYLPQTTIVISLFTLYFSVVATYLIVAYQEGSKLTTTQTFIATSVYIFAALLFVYSIILAQLGIREMFQSLWDWSVVLETDYGHPNRMVKPEWVGEKPYYSYALLFFCTISPLYFMWSVRHPKKE